MKRNALLTTLGLICALGAYARPASGRAAADSVDSKTKMLEEVTVSADAPLQVKDMLVVRPSASDIKASQDALSLFQKLPLPGLEANPISRSISVDNGSPYILINGIPSTMAELNALQPKNISKIEYSRITPIRYASKGYVGFLSITLKERQDGGDVYLWARSAVNTAFVDADLRASYHQQASRFTIAYSPSWRNYQSVYDKTVSSYIGDDFRVNLEASDRNPFNYHNHALSLRYDYAPSMKTLFSATLRGTPSASTRRLMGYTFDSVTGEYDNRNYSKTTGFAPSLDLFFRRDFNESNSLEAQVVGTLGDSKYRREYEYLYPDGNVDTYVTDADSRRNSLITELSYIHAFREGTQLYAGYQNTLSSSRNHYLDNGYRAKLTENNNYVYVRASRSFGPVYLSLGTGMKMYWMDNDLNKRHFSQNTTLLQANWRISGMWNLGAAFNFVPSIPSLSSLTDNPQQVSPYLISNGAANLKGSRSLYLQVMPSFQIKKFIAAMRVAYQNVSNPVISDVRYIGNRLFLSQEINALHSRSIYGSLSMRLMDIHGFGANVSLNVNHYETAAAEWTDRVTAFSGNFTLWWVRGPITISYWRKIPGKYLNGRTVWKEENGDSLTVNYTPDKHWTIGASWMYMFDTKGTRYPSWDYSEVNPSVRTRYIKDNGNMIVLSFTYNTNFGAIFRSAKRNLNNADNESSLLKL